MLKKNILMWTQWAALSLLVGGPIAVLFKGLPL